MKLKIILLLIVLSCICLTLVEAGSDEWKSSKRSYGKRDQPKSRYKLSARKYKRRDEGHVSENSPCSCEESCSTCSTSGTSSSTEGEHTSGIENTADCECHISIKFRAKVQEHSLEEASYDEYEQCRELRQRWKQYDNDYICEKDNVDYPTTFNQMCPSWNQNSERSIITKQVIRWKNDKPILMKWFFTQSEFEVWGIWVNGILVKAKHYYYYKSHLKFEALFPKGKHRIVVYSASDYFWKTDGDKDYDYFPNIYNAALKLGNPVNAKIKKLSESKFRDALCNIDCEDSSSSDYEDCSHHKKHHGAYASNPWGAYKPLYGRKVSHAGGYGSKNWEDKWDVKPESKFRHLDDQAAKIHEVAIWETKDYNGPYANYATPYLLFGSHSTSKAVGHTFGKVRTLSAYAQCSKRNWAKKAFKSRKNEGHYNKKTAWKKRSHKKPHHGKSEKHHGKSEKHHGKSEKHHGKSWKPDHKEKWSHKEPHHEKPHHDKKGGYEAP